MHSYNFNNQTAETHTRTTTIIDGKQALTVRPKVKGEGIIGVYIEVNSQLRFSMYGENIAEDEVILKILNSLKFKE